MPLPLVPKSQTVGNREHAVSKHGVKNVSHAQINTNHRDGENPRKPTSVKSATATTNDSEVGNRDAILTEGEAKLAAKKTTKLAPDVQQENDLPVTAANTKIYKSAKAPEIIRDVVLAEREAKRLAKLAAKNKLNTVVGTKSELPPTSQSHVESVDLVQPATETAETGAPPPNAQLTKPLQSVSAGDGTAGDGGGTAKPVLSKAERRAKQEAQRAAKTAAQAAKVTLPTKSAAAGAAAKVPSGSTSAEAAAKRSPKSGTSTSPQPPAAQSALHRVKLFNHLYMNRSQRAPHEIDNLMLHPAVLKLGAQYANRVVVGSNARCIAFLNTMKIVSAQFVCISYDVAAYGQCHLIPIQCNFCIQNIQIIRDYETPAQKEFSRGLEAELQPTVAYLQHCRPLSVSISNALKHLKWQVTQLDAERSEAEQRAQLLDSVDTYIRDQVEKAAQAISISVQQKISNGDVILTFGCSSLISHILDEAQKRQVDFRVVVVDARPDHEGQEMLRRLVAQGIRCTCVLVNAIGFIMPVVSARIALL